MNYLQKKPYNESKIQQKQRQSIITYHGKLKTSGAKKKKNISMLTLICFICWSVCLGFCKESTSKIILLTPQNNDFLQIFEAQSKAHSIFQDS